ncbi:MAG: hypothetical protein CMK25_05765 [Porticoccaceae bacterium]|nr:hypothetical protein [Porticoccaceae bacterium]
MFYTLRKAQILNERWRLHYKEVRPHSALGYKSPAPQIRQSLTTWITTEDVLESQTMVL